MRTLSLNEKLAQMRAKYLDDDHYYQNDQLSEQDVKKSIAIKKKLVQLESIRCQKLRAGDDLTLIDDKIAKLKKDFQSREDHTDRRR
ncbi:hypothetical protein [Streptococcus ferus]|uniref:hypothetical protein n=1 Tax=Streptococcus ferus TaxID=1345 RepID=UPI0035A15948